MEAGSSVVCLQLQLRRLIMPVWMNKLFFKKKLVMVRENQLYLFEISQQQKKKLYLFGVAFL